MNILYKGIDVSKHNGKVDWSKISKNEVQFVIIRAGYGFSTVDPQFKANIEGAIKAGLHIGIYWFSYAGSTAHAKSEAEFCLKTIEPYRKHIDFPVWFDWEYESHDYVVEHYGINPTKKAVSDAAIKFMETIKAAGYKVGNYSNPNYFSQYFDDRVKSSYDTWLAHVGKDGATRSSTNYKGKYTVWQYSWVRKFRGISGNVDADYCYVDYGGNAATPYTVSAVNTYQIPKVITYLTDVNKIVITS